MELNRRMPRRAVLYTLFVATLVGCGIGTSGDGDAGESQATTGQSSSSDNAESRDESGEAVGADESSEQAPMSSKRVHPSFELSQEKLMELVSVAPKDTREAVRRRPEYFLELADELLELPPRQLRLVDKDHSLSPDYEPQDLVSLDGYSDVLMLNRGGLRLRAVVLPDLIAMSEAARRNDARLPVSSTYRSYEYQDNLFQRHVDELGEEQASRVSARPGTSQHQLGTAVDFGSITPDFAETQAGRWLAANAAEFGFSMSYPQGYEELTGYSYEPWHFRWIGRTATEMETTFFSGIQQHMLEYWNEQSDELRRRRK